MTDIIISYALSLLNDRNNGKAIFEIFCQKLISKYLDNEFLPASGSDAGGDGGIDGWSILGEGSKKKYAFSIDQKSKQKIESEIVKIENRNYKEIYFLTNQPIRSKIKEDICKKYQEINIIIYCLEDLTEFVKRHEDLGKYIHLPEIQNPIQIDYLKDRNQFAKDTKSILKYIDRMVTRHNNSTNEWENLSLIDYCNNLPKFTILQAAAGYGKTCALKQLHQKILFKETGTLLPPVFISLSSYIPTNLLSMIKENLSESNDYRCNDYILLLDGYDEVKDTYKEELLKEIHHIISHQGYIRKVLISVRQNTYNQNEFEGFKDKELLYINELRERDINLLLDSYSIPKENRSNLLLNSAFRSLSDNVFYVIKLIEYYIDKNNLATDIIDLFTFIVEQETNQLFRDKKVNIKSLESLALYMTLHQLNEVNDIELLKSFNLDCKFQPFRFSHKSIQEFLAASKIAQQKQQIQKIILARGNLFIPYLTNTLGFVLNILNSDINYQDAFNALIEWSLPGNGNAKRLLLIESDKISSALNHSIFRAVLDQESKAGNAWENTYILAKFGLHKYAKNQNLEYLFSLIVKSINTDSYHYYTLLLQSITNNDLKQLDVNYQNSILNFFIELLNEDKIVKNTSFISSLLYSISYFPQVRDFSENEISFLVNQLTSIETEESIIDNLCQLLITYEKKFDIKLYYKIYDFIMEKVMLERGQMAHFVVPQTTDDTYHEPLRVTHWYTFIPLTEIVLNEEPTLLWNLMKYTLKKEEKYQDRHSSSSEFKKLYNVFFKHLEQEIRKGSIDDSKVDLLVNWIICDGKSYVDSELWDYLSTFCSCSLLLEIARKVLSKSDRSHFHRNIIDTFVKKLILTPESFDQFKNDFLLSENQKLIETFNTFMNYLDESLDIYIYAMENIPSEMKESIERRKEEYEKYTKREEYNQDTPKRDYHIAFKREELLDSFDGIFHEFNLLPITKENFWDKEHDGILENYNDFSRYIFKSIYWANEKVVNKDLIKGYIDSSNWDINYMRQLVQYFSHNNVDINIIDDSEKALVYEWIQKILDVYPITDVTKSYKYVHITLSYILRTSKFLINDLEISSGECEKFIGLTFAAFPNVVEGSFIVNYDSYSLDYLDNYIIPRDIIDYIVENFKHAFTNERIMISICGYILGHKDILLPFQIQEIKRLLIEYIKDHLKESYYTVIIDCAFFTGFSITDIDIDLLSDALVLNDKEYDFKSNYASTFLNSSSHKITNIEIKHVSKALYKAFNQTDYLFHKKTIAEYYIMFNPNDGDVFKFYADYLLSDDSHTILNFFHRGGLNTVLKTSDLNQLQIVEKLFRYSKSKEKSNRRDAILAMAVSSFKAMAENISLRDELDIIINSIRILAEEGHYFMYSVIQEIENDHAIKNYEPFSLKQIIALQTTIE